MQRIGTDSFALLTGGHFQGEGMVIIQQRVAQRIIFVRQLHHGRIDVVAFLHAVPLGKGAGGDIADDDLQRNDGALFQPVEGGGVILIVHEIWSSGSSVR